MQPRFIPKTAIMEFDNILQKSTRKNQSITGNLSSIIIENYLFFFQKNLKT